MRAVKLKHVPNTDFCCSGFVPEGYTMEQADTYFIPMNDTGGGSWLFHLSSADHLSKSKSYFNEALNRSSVPVLFVSYPKESDGLQKR